ncbi:MAG: efflux RND transporter permease subunit [Candidatus Omnitrophota bacterium]
MNIPEFSIKKPVTTIMIYLGLVLLGFISLQRLPQELFPPVTYPQITISTSYQNAAPEEIETLLTKPLEEVVGTVNGLKKINSVSREGLSLITLEFSWDTDMNFASLNVREKIDLVKEMLPRDADEPLIVRFNPFELPVMILSVTQTEKDTSKGSDYYQAELLHFSKRYIKDKLDKIEGVAYCRLTGGLEREILAEINQGRLFASSISILDVDEALRRANLNYPAGSIKGDFYEYLVRTMGEFQKVSDLSDVPVSLDEYTDYAKMFQPMEKPKEQKRLILLSDIGVIKDTYKEVTSYSRYNGKNNVSISIYKQSGSNTVDVSNNVKKAVDKLKDELPKEVFIKTIYDQADFIKGSINGVKNAAIMGAFLAFIVLLLFLQSYRTSMIIVISIPISIIVVFGLMYMKGISLNMISLGGLALGVGMLVDASIVVIENIFRHVEEEKEDVKTASLRGTNEVIGAINSAVLTTVVVFLPMIFVIGVVGQLFKELAFTVTYSLLASLAAAVTLVPLMCSKIPAAAYFIKKKRKETARYSVSDNIFNAFNSWVVKLENGYAKLLKNFLKNKERGLIIVFVVFIISLAVFVFLDKQLVPRVDEGQFTIKLDMPNGTLLEVTDASARKIEKLLLEDKVVKDVTVNVGSSKAEKIGETLGSHQAEILVNLAGKKKRKISTDEFIRQFKEKIENQNLRAANIEYLIRGSILQALGEERAPVVIEIKGEDLKTLGALAEEVQGQIKDIPRVYGIKSSVEETSPETKISIVKDKAFLYNLSVADIARVVQAALKGYIPTKFKQEGEEIDIRVRLSAEDRENFSSLGRLIIHSPLGVNLLLSDVASLSQGRGPFAIKRLDRERVVLVSANLTGGKHSRVIADVSKRLKKIKIPSGYSVSMGGESEEMKQSFASLRFALILSFILIYMIMAAQFESLWQPFIIMFSVPLGMIGVAAALLLTNTPLSVMALFGIIILGGIVVDNGIVLIDYVNLLIRERGKTVYDALIEGGRVRLKPIVITSLTTVLGLVPLAFGIGDDSGIQSPMAITVIGGMLVSTFLTLLVIPAIYLISYERK